MSCLTPLFHPTDSRWHGSQKAYYSLYHIKNAVFVLFIILLIVEGALFRKWWPDRYDVDDEYAPYDFGLRIAIALAPELFFTLLTGFLMFTSKLHPIYALIISFCMFGLYAGACFINLLVVLSNEVWFKRASDWDVICYVEAGFQGLLGLLHAIMFIFGCIATHRWRIARKGNKNVPLKVVESHSSA